MRVCAGKRQALPLRAFSSWDIVVLLVAAAGGEGGPALVSEALVCPVGAEGVWLGSSGLSGIGMRKI